jgi:phosphatidylglycerol:prolipoprotein diacylglycerol transferase
VAFEWSDYHGNWMQIVNIRNGGIAIHGALIGAVIAAVWYTRRKGYSFWRIADICAPSLLIGQIIGRWGNFTNQEAHGGPVDVSFLKHTLHLPDFIVNQMNISGVYYHPTFLYESVWNLAVLVLLLVIRRKFAIRSGELFLSYLGLYSIGRFFIEGLRTDSLAFHGPTWIAQLFHGLWTPMAVLFGDPGALPDGVNVRAAQAISMGILVLALVLAWLRRQTGSSSERYRDPILRRMK